MATTCLWRPGEYHAGVLLELPNQGKAHFESEVTYSRSPVAHIGFLEPFTEMF